jgi:hypothetical protein
MSVNIPPNRGQLVLIVEHLRKNRHLLLSIGGVRGNPAR